MLHPTKEKFREPRKRLVLKGLRGSLEGNSIELRLKDGFQGVEGKGTT